MQDVDFEFDRMDGSHTKLARLMGQAWRPFNFPSSAEARVWSTTQTIPASTLMSPLVSNSALTPAWPRSRVC